MPPRAIGTATISFGLVSVPVDLYTSAESGATVSFNLVHKKCGTRLKQQYVCPKDEEIVPQEDRAKGFEFTKDQFVIFTPDELKALDEKATNTIDIAEFVPLAKVDRIYLDRVYYLGPHKGGDRAYRLLAQALNETGRAALGQYSARGRQYLVLLRPMDDLIVMEQLHYQTELKPAAEVPVAKGEVKPKELDLAIQLIEQSSTDSFEPEKYHDVVQERVRDAIERKVEGEEITAEPAQDVGGKIIDLMDALKASLAKGGTETEADEGKQRRTGRKEGRRRAS